MDDTDKRESDAPEQTPPKIKAEDNPWYLLATLYGVPGPNPNLELRAENRRVWNHCLASFLHLHERDALIKYGKYTETELEPIFPIRWQTELGEALARRVQNEGQGSGLEAWYAAARKNMPNIDFSNAVRSRRQF
jgi:hypothetical protein